MRYEKIHVEGMTIPVRPSSFLQAFLIHHF